jgi:RND family efflux transporter MFP subunit
MPAFHTPITYRLGLLATAMVVIGCSPQRPSAPAESAVYVTTVRNETSDMQRVFSGSIRPRIESDIGFRVGGRVTERLVELGEPVRAGQVMARLDPTDYRLAVQAAADQQRAAEVDAVQSASDAERFRRLMGDGSVGAADAERQQARADAAAARLKQAQSQLELARNRAGYAALTAPFDGVVTALRLELGQMVTEGQAVVSVARPGELEVVVDVPEALVADLQQWRAEAVPGFGTESVGVGAVSSAQPIALRLREMAPSAHPVSRTTRVRYAMVSPTQIKTVHMGMSAEVRLRQPGTTTGATLPVGALLTTTEGTFVWTVDAADGALMRQKVQLQSQTTGQVRVGGLKDGALVVTAGAQKLDAGMKVRPVARPLAEALSPVAAR